MIEYLKFGVHAAGVGGVYTGFGEYVATCKAAGVPCIVQAVDNAGPCVAVQDLGRPFDVIVFRLNNRDGKNLEETNYAADPIAYARKRMADIATYWPPELNRTRVWTVPVNEPSKEDGDVQWLAAFTLECARISVASGWRHLAYGWSSGTPEKTFWELPDVLDYLRLCNQHPDLLGISLHEYSLTDDLQSGSPWLIGRFENIHAACGKHNIPHPPVVIGEFGWREASLRPAPGTFQSQLDWAQNIYGPHTNILGAAIWTLGKWSGSVAQDMASHMPTLSAMAAAYPPYKYEEEPMGNHKAIVVKLPQDMTEAEWLQCAKIAYSSRHTMTASHDDMMTVLRGGNSKSYVKFSHPDRDLGAVEMVEDAGYGWEPLYGNAPPPPPIGDKIDTLRYFVPSGQYGYKIVMKVGSGTQPMQMEKRANDVILRKGDGTWIDGKKYQDSEQWRVKDGQVQKGVDTSDAGNGGRDAYDLGWAQWIPRYVRVSETYRSAPVVRRFDRTNCQTISTNQANDYLHIKALIPTWISPANSKIILNDVLVIEWRSGTTDLSEPPNETYYLCREFGYVGWGSHFIVEITEGQQPLSGKLDCGL